MVEHNQSANHPAGVGYSNKYKFNGKELDDATQMYYYGARYYDPRISIFVSVDPLAEQTMTPYQYVTNNPIMFTDPTGMSADPIHDVKGNVIGDDGKTDGKAYVVQGKLEDKVREATSNNQFYTGDLELGSNGASVPTGDVLNEVINSVNDTDVSKVENGGHSMYGQNTATRWDSGPQYKEEQVANRPGADASFYASASIKPYTVNGKRQFVDLKEVEFTWHTHPLITTSNGARLGWSDPSGGQKGAKKGDIPNIGKNISAGFRGTAFTIGLRDKNVQFYNENGSYLKISYDVFKKIGSKK